ncbi:MAG: hypothetical protein IPG04_15805 [Polyangiaceae bacterium]|nr:hypothetical protein [Polyangiaceae bacterium]
MQGVELVRQVIERVREVGLGALGHAGEPRPLSDAALDALRFPSGAPLSPALREWLAFDASMLGWFEDLDAPSFAALDVAKVAEQAYGPGKRSEAFATLVRQTLPGHGFLLPRGRLARRFLYVGDPDCTGEPPVLVFDVDGRPYVGVEHPGFDVWLGFAAGLVAPAREVLGGFADDERFAPRMKEHAERLFGGKLSLQLGDEGFDPGAQREVAIGETVLLGPLDELREGYVVVEEVVNPFTGLPMRVAAPASAVRDRDLDR